MLSGNRNFEGRIHPQVQRELLASPPLVVAYALAGCMDIDLTTEPLGKDKAGKHVFLKDDVADRRRDAKTVAAASVTDAMFRERYSDVFAGDERWREACRSPPGERFAWDPKSEYVKRPPYFDGMPEAAGAACGHHRRARAGGARRFGDDRSHLAGRQHREAPRPRRSICSSTASSRRTSTRTARGAAITK